MYVHGYKSKRLLALYQRCTRSVRVLQVLAIPVDSFLHLGDSAHWPINYMVTSQGFRCEAVIAPDGPTNSRDGHTLPDRTECSTPYMYFSLSIRTRKVLVAE